VELVVIAMLSSLSSTAGSVIIATGSRGWWTSYRHHWQLWVVAGMVLVAIINVGDGVVVHRCC